MHKLVKQNLTVFEKQKIENILTKIFVLFLCFIFSWEQTLRFRFENKGTQYFLNSIFLK